MDYKVFELAHILGRTSGWIALILHTLNGVIPFREDVRLELWECTKESGICSVIFLVCGWLFSSYYTDQMACAQQMLRFGVYFMVCFGILIVAGLIQRLARSMTSQELNRKIRKSALTYCLVFFFVGYLLT